MEELSRLLKVVDHALASAAAAADEIAAAVVVAEARRLIAAAEAAVEARNRLAIRIGRPDQPTMEELRFAINAEKAAWEAVKAALLDMDDLNHS